MLRIVINCDLWSYWWSISFSCCFESLPPGQSAPSRSSGFADSVRSEFCVGGFKKEARQAGNIVSSTSDWLSSSHIDTICYVAHHAHIFGGTQSSPRGWWLELLGSAEPTKSLSNASMMLFSGGGDT